MSDFVEAIEEGRIVKVSEDYAKREGLIILKKPEIAPNNRGVTPSFYFQEPRAKKEAIRPFIHIEKKPDWKEKQVLSELIDNFQWTIKRERRKKGLTRKQLARLINETDEKLRIIEEGRLPEKDFILINKIQKAIGLNLRKDGKEFDISVRDLMSKAKKEEYRELEKDGIEILDEEI